jgi:hypothetical protein
VAADSDMAWQILARESPRAARSETEPLAEEPAVPAVVVSATAAGAATPPATAFVLPPPKPVRPRPGALSLDGVRPEHTWTAR